MPNSLLSQHQVLERLTLFPTVSPEIPLIRRKNSTVSQVLGKNDQRCIGQIHGEISILFHKLVDTRGVIMGEIEYVEGAAAVGLDKLLLCWITQVLQQQVTGLCQNGPGRDERLV